ADSCSARRLIAHLQPVAPRPRFPSLQGNDADADRGSVGRRDRLSARFPCRFSVPDFLGDIGRLDFLQRLRLHSPCLVPTFWFFPPRPRVNRGRGVFRDSCAGMCRAWRLHARRWLGFLEKPLRGITERVRYGLAFTKGKLDTSEQPA